MARKTYEMEFQLQAQLASSYSKTFSQAQQQLVSMQKEITALSKTQSDISAYQKQQSAVAATEKKLQSLEEQYQNIQREIQETEGFSASLQNRLIAKQMQIDRTSSSLQQETRRLNEMGQSLEAAGVDTANLTKSTERLSSQMDDLKQSQMQAAESAEEFGAQSSQAINLVGDALATAGITMALKEIVEYYAMCSKASMEFESAMTGVAKTTDLTDEEFADMSNAIQDMSTRMPATANEIAAVTEAAGQLGIAKGDLVSFTETMINLGESTNLTADEAATALARFANITGTSADNYDRLGAVIVDLGNNFATTEAEITEMATRLASAGTLAGLTESQIMALAASMSSVGIEAEAGGTAMTQTLGAIEQAVANGNEALDEFARIAGMSAAEFSSAWNSDPMTALTSFIAGLGNLESQGESAVLVLDDLGLTGIRQSNMLQSLGLAAETMGKAVSVADTAWEENVALVNEANKRYSTTESQLTMMQNAYKRVTVAIGNAYNPALKQAYKAGTDVLNGIAIFIDENPALVNGISAFAGVMGIAAVGMTGYTVAVNAATAASTAFGAASGIALGPVVAVTAGLAAVVGVISAVATVVSDEAVPSVEELTQAAQNSSAAMEEASAGYSDSMAQVEASAGMADTYIAKLEELEEAGLKTQEQQEEYHNTLVLLTELVPELSDQINLQTNEIYGGTDALKANTAAWKENAKEQAKQEYLKSVQEEYNSVMAEAADNSLQYTKASYELREAENKMAEMTRRMNALYDEAVQKSQRLQEEQGITADVTGFLNEEYWNLWNTMDSVGAEIEEASQTAEAYKQAMEEDQEAVENMNSTLELADESWNNFISSQNNAAESSANLADQTQAVNNAISGITGQLDSLIASYAEAYNAAYNSVSGQYAIWDEAAEIVPTSIISINDALASQVSYWQNYNANLQYLQENFSQFAGLQEVVASFADGSAESINAVAGITQALKDGNYEDVQAMISNWKSLQAETDTTSSDIAELKTNALAQMDELVSGVETDISNMNLSEEARASGRATLQGYISGLDSLTPTLDAKISAINSRIISALNAAASVPASGGGGLKHAYASGTQNAERGFALVGEEGPELVFFNGGEKVLTAEETAALQSGPEVTFFDPRFMAALESPSYVGAASAGSGGITLEMSIVVEGNATPETVAMLQDYEDSFAEKVLAVINDANIDAKRGAYS